MYHVFCNPSIHFVSWKPFCVLHRSECLKPQCYGILDIYEISSYLLYYWINTSVKLAIFFREPLLSLEDVTFCTMKILTIRIHGMRNQTVWLRILGKSLMLSQANKVKRISAKLKNLNFQRASWQVMLRTWARQWTDSAFNQYLVEGTEKMKIHVPRIGGVDPCVQQYWRCWIWY